MGLAQAIDVAAHSIRSRILKVVVVVQVERESVVAAHSIRSRILKVVEYDHQMRARLVVAAHSIRSRILKAGLLSPLQLFQGCRSPFDPFEDTESLSEKFTS